MKFSRLFKNTSISTFKPFITKSFKNFASAHSQVIVIGAGTAGLAVSSQLVHQNVVSGKNIAIFDPSSTHYYQPGYTKLGGGILNSLKHIEYNLKEITKDYNFQNVGVKQINPEKNEIVTESNDVWTYDQLVVAPGMEVKLDSIPGKYNL